MGSLKKRRKAKINKHKRKKKSRANRHKKRTWQKQFSSLAPHCAGHINGSDTTYGNLT